VGRRLGGDPLLAPDDPLRPQIRDVPGAEDEDAGQAVEFNLYLPNGQGAVETATLGIRALSSNVSEVRSTSR
jgi:hypothetical protein